jgi:hypothetical protein
MTIIESLHQQPPGTHLEQLVNIVSIIVIGEFGVESSKVGIVDVLKDQTWSLTLLLSTRDRADYLIISDDV